MIIVTKKNTNPEEETKMMRRLMSKLFGKKKVTVEKAMTAQATEITKVLNQLDALAGKAGN
jgi:phage I-like protein